MNFTIEYNQGFYHALRIKNSAENNPYTKGSDEYIKWEAGYLYAKEAQQSR